MTGIVLVHGAGIGSHVRDRVRSLLRGPVVTPDRPASGSLACEVAFLAGEAIGRVYGRAWEHVVDRADRATVARELAMFQAFEPSAAVGPTPPVLVTVGARSSDERHLAAERVAALIGAEVVEIHGAAHAVHLERPTEFARLLAL